jgi:hypothetical protein
MTTNLSMHEVMDASAGRIDASLYRDAEGHEVWRITFDGQTEVEDVASDHDADWFVRNLAESLNIAAAR